MTDERNIRALSKNLKLNARGKALCEFNGQQALVSRFSTHPKWEFHPEADEYLQVIEGDMELVLLEGRGRRELRLGPDCVCVVPKGVWHSPVPLGEVTLLSVGRYHGTLVSNEDDPRT